MYGRHPISEDRRKKIIHQLSWGDLDRLLTKTDDEKISKRLIFVKNLYRGTLSKRQPHVSASPNQPGSVGSRSHFRTVRMVASSTVSPESL
jgi:hypothetical protein